MTGDEWADADRGAGSCVGSGYRTATSCGRRPAMSDVGCEQFAVVKPSGTSCHSHETFRGSHDRNWRKPSAGLMMPKIGSTNMGGALAPPRESGARPGAEAGTQAKGAAGKPKWRRAKGRAPVSHPGGTNSLEEFAGRREILKSARRRRGTEQDLRAKADDKLTPKTDILHRGACSLAKQWSAGCRNSARFTRLRFWGKELLSGLVDKVRKRHFPATSKCLEKAEPLV